MKEGSRQFVWATIGVPEGDETLLGDFQEAYIHQSHMDESLDFVIKVEGKKQKDKLRVSFVRDDYL